MDCYRLWTTRSLLRKRVATEAVGHVLTVFASMVFGVSPLKFTYESNEASAGSLNLTDLRLHLSKIILCAICPSLQPTVKPCSRRSACFRSTIYLRRSPRNTG